MTLTIYYFFLYIPTTLIAWLIAYFYTFTKRKIQVPNLFIFINIFIVNSIIVIVSEFLKRPNIDGSASVDINLISILINLFVSFFFCRLLYIFLQGEVGLKSEKLGAKLLINKRGKLIFYFFIALMLLVFLVGKYNFPSNKYESFYNLKGFSLGEPFGSELVKSQGFNELTSSSCLDDEDSGCYLNPKLNILLGFKASRVNRILYSCNARDESSLRGVSCGDSLINIKSKFDIEIIPYCTLNNDHRMLLVFRSVYYYVLDLEKVIALGVANPDFMPSILNGYWTLCK